MDDFKWIFYVAVAIIYFIVKSRNKKVASPTSENRPFESGQPTSTTSKPVTFEDLLKEIQQSKPSAQKPAPRAIPLSKPQRSPKNIEYDQITKPGKPLEDANYDYRDQDKIYETYEKAKKEAFNRPSLEETMKVEDTVVKYGQFKEYSQEVVPSLASVIGKEFQEKKNLRKAFVLSEILNRKY